MPAGTLARRGSFPRQVPAVDPSSYVRRFVLCRLLAHAVSPSPHLHLGEDRDRLGGSRCERKQRRGRFLIHGQHALKDHGLIDDAAVPKMADRDDQTRATVAIARIELACFRPSAAVLSFGMCPEPAPIPLDNLIQRVRHRNGALPQSVWPALLLPATNSDPENGDSGIYNR
jgi:hypothetical protein